MNNFCFNDGKQNQGEPQHSMHEDIHTRTFDFFVHQVANQEERGWENTKKQDDPMVIKGAPMSSVLGLKQANLIGYEFLNDFLMPAHK